MPALHFKLNFQGTGASCEQGLQAHPAAPASHAASLGSRKRGDLPVRGARLIILDAQLLKQLSLLAVHVLAHHVPANPKEHVNQGGVLSCDLCSAGARTIHMGTEQAAGQGSRCGRWGGG